MKTGLPEGYRTEAVDGGVRQHFPGGYREYQKVRGGFITHCVTDGRTVSQNELNKIFNDHVHFQDASVWNENFPFKFRQEISELKNELSLWKKAAKASAAVALLAICYKTIY